MTNNILTYTDIGNSENPEYMLIFSTYTGQQGNVILPCSKNVFDLLMSIIRLPMDKTLVSGWIKENKSAKNLKADDLFYRYEMSEEEQLERYGNRRKKFHEVTYLDELHEKIEHINPKKTLLFGNDLAQAYIGADWNEFDENGSQLTSNHGTWFKVNGRFVMATFNVFEIFKSWDYRQMFERDLHRFLDINPYNDMYKPEFELLHEEPTQFPEIDIAQKIFFDIETTGLDYHDNDIISIGWKNESMDYVKIVRSPSREFLTHFLEALEHNQCEVIGHNVKFDLGFLYWKTKKVYYFPVKDSMFAAHVYGEFYKNLKHLVIMNTNRLGNNGYKQGNGFDSLLYLAEDVITTQIVYDLYCERIDVENNYAFNLICELIIPTLVMTMRGMYVNKETLNQVEKRVDESAENILKELQSHSDTEINFNSSSQVSEFLLKHNVPLTEKTAKGAYSVSVKAIEHIDHPLVELYLEYADIKTTRTYIKKYKELLTDENFVHPEYNLMGTKTGRISSSNPNGQQIPNKFGFKQMFQSRFDNGYIGLVDLAKAEMKVAAYVSGDNKMAKACAIGDIYSNIASSVYKIPLEDVDSKIRSTTKQVTLGTMYGGSPYGIAMQSKGKVTPEQAEFVYNGFFTEFDELSRWKNSVESNAVKQGYVMSLTGRRRNLMDQLSQNSRKAIARAKRQASNTPIQGLSSDLSMTIVLEVWKLFREHNLKSLVITTVHDSTIFDIHPDELEIVAELVQKAYVIAYNKTPLADISDIVDILPITGELIISDSWVACEDKEPEYHNPMFVYECSSHMEIV